MTKRKFTPPTEFPAEYVDGNGDKAVILGRAPNELFPFIGHYFEGYAGSWTEEGRCFIETKSPHDLHDTPKRITTWHNVHVKKVFGSYESREEADVWASEPRLCVYRIEHDEDGGNPKIFVEEV